MVSLLGAPQWAQASLAVASKRKKAYGLNLDKKEL
jgi:hypothetical protein